jgi:plasmid maintenance system killer protein
MEISYKTKKLKTQLTSVEVLDRSFGSIAAMISRRLQQIKDAKNLYTLQTLKALCCRQLTANPFAEWVIDIESGYCLLFDLDHNPEEITVNGALDTSMITKLRIITITRY